MHVRVTLARTVMEYADLDVKNVASVAEAVAQVSEQLTQTPASRARLLNTAMWLRGEVVTDVDIVETRGE